MRLRTHAYRFIINYVICGCLRQIDRRPVNRRTDRKHPKMLFKHWRDNWAKWIQSIIILLILYHSYESHCCCFAGLDIIARMEIILILRILVYLCCIYYDCGIFMYIILHEYVVGHSYRILLSLFWLFNVLHVFVIAVIITIITIISSSAAHSRSIDLV